MAAFDTIACYTCYMWGRLWLHRKTDAWGWFQLELLFEMIFFLILFVFLLLLQGDTGPQGLPGPPGVAGPQVSESQ